MMGGMRICKSEEKLRIFFPIFVHILRAYIFSSSVLEYK